MTDFLGPFFEFLGFVVHAALDCAAVMPPSGPAGAHEPAPPPAADRIQMMWDRDLDF